MTKKDFAQMVKEKILILDGATGSNLQKEGMPSGVCPEQWILEHPQPLIKLQKAYAEAGSQIVYAPTFGANRLKLGEYGLEKKTEEMNRALVALTREAVGENVLVAGDLTMTGQALEPMGELTVEELTDVYRQQAAALKEAGADLLVVETMLSLAETRAALIGVKEACDLPVLVTMTFGESGKTLYGTDGVTAVEVLQSLGADGVGLNCGAGPDKMLPVFRQMAAHAKVPLIAKPNAGLPRVAADGSTVYDMEAEVFGTWMEQMMEAGAAMAGGCCGTDPAYIRILAQLAETKKAPVTGAGSDENERYVTTERRTVRLPDHPRVETVGPKNNQELLEEYRMGICDTLPELLEDALDEEPDLICLSVDGEGISGKELVGDVIQEALQTVTLPLAFSSEDLQVLETALCHYPGRAAVIPKNNNREALKNLCEKYGAVILD